MADLPSDEDEEPQLVFNCRPNAQPPPTGRTTDTEKKQPPVSECVIASKSLASPINRAEAKASVRTESQDKTQMGAVGQNDDDEEEPQLVFANPPVSQKPTDCLPDTVKKGSTGSNGEVGGTLIKTSTDGNTSRVFDGADSSDDESPIVASAIQTIVPSSEAIVSLVEEEERRRNSNVSVSNGHSNGHLRGNSDVNESSKRGGAHTINDPYVDMETLQKLTPVIPSKDSKGFTFYNVPLSCIKHACFRDFSQHVMDPIEITLEILLKQCSTQPKRNQLIESVINEHGSHKLLERAWILSIPSDKGSEHSQFGIFVPVKLSKSSADNSELLSALQKCTPLFQLHTKHLDAQKLYKSPSGMEILPRRLSPSKNLMPYNTIKGDHAHNNDPSSWPSYLFMASASNSNKRNHEAIAPVQIVERCTRASKPSNAMAVPNDTLHISTQRTEIERAQNVPSMLPSEPISMDETSNGTLCQYSVDGQYQSNHVNATKEIGNGCEVISESITLEYNNLGDTWPTITPPRPIVGVKKLVVEFRFGV
tara:strand:- start:2650 stop:4257 length:1608 start_codon:yes stop_codon:yes gene_type:complete